MSCTKKEIKRKIESAVGLLIERDYQLLNLNANERSISHRLAIYLGLFFEDWNVDCEYNRLDEETKRFDNLKQLKEIFSDIEIGDINANDDEAKTVYPDIIIHKRKKQNNVLVIEIKKSIGSNDRKDNIDRMKLHEFKEQLQYKNTVFLKIKTGTNLSPPFNNMQDTIGKVIEELQINKNWSELIKQNN